MIKHKADIYSRLSVLTGKTIAELERALNAGNGAIGKAIERNSTVKPTMIDKIAKMYPEHVAALGLHLNTGSPDTDAREVSEPARTYNLQRTQQKEIEDFVILPVYEVGAEGGTGDGITDLTNVEYRKVPRSMFDDAEAILPVYGNSMSPGYPPGSEVAIARDYSNYFEYGDVYVIKIKNKARPLLKRVEQCEEDDCILLVSDNEMKRETGPLAGRFYYPPQKLPLILIEEVWEVIGDCKRRKNKSILLRQFREQQNT